MAEPNVEIIRVILPETRVITFNADTIGPPGGSGYSGYSGFSGTPGILGTSGASGYSGYSGDPAQQSGYSGYSGKSGYSGFCGLSGYSGYSGSGVSGYSGYSGSGVSGYSGYCGTSGYSGFSSLSGYSGYSSISGYSGFCGLSGYSGYSGSGVSGYSGYSGLGLSGYSGFCGLSGYSGFCGLSGYSGFCGLSGYSGFSGPGGGQSGFSGYSGSGISGYSGYCGLSGYSGFCGLSGYSGYSGSGISGYSGYCGLSGYSGFCGLSGYSGFSSTSGYSGFCGLSGYSGYSGSGVSGYSGYSGQIGFTGTQPYWPQDTSSDISTYRVIDTAPENAAEISESAVCNNNTVLIRAFATSSAGLGTTLIPSGEWTFDFFATVTSLALASNIVVEVYSRTSGGAETLLFTTTSPAIGTISISAASEIEWSEIHTEFAINTTDRLVYKVYGKTVSLTNVTVAFYYLGQTHYSRVNTSLTPIGISGFSGYSGFCGLSGYSGYSSTSGYSGYSGSGVSGYSGYSGSGVSGYSGYSGSGLSGYSGYSGISGWSGYSGYSGSGLSGYSGYSGSGVSGYSGYSGPTGTGAASKQLYVQNVPLTEVFAPIVTKAGTVTGTAGVGSSLFLHRIWIEANMTLSEIQKAMSIAFNATSQGAGTLSQSFCLYSFGNSTSLASVMSISGTSAWNTGTVTAGASTSLTQFQGGWSMPLIQPMTFATTSVAPGEYVVGQIFNFAQATSTWTINFYGFVNQSITTATGTAYSGIGLVGGSVLTQGFAAATTVTAWTVAPPNMGLGKVGSTASFSAAAASSVMATATANSTVSLLLNQGTGSFQAVTNAAGLFSAGSGINSTGTNSAVSIVGTSSSLANFGFIGTNSTTSGLPTAFFVGIMSTGAIPTAITVTSTAVTYSGSVAFVQPWFALCGS